ncbi:helix-turn-helix domain-containing protein [Streptomyces dysideae]|uniref:DNA-binding protein n=1 Tax=Streptomyces dysideae TaxID=909626 RepID=A0A117S0K5_9ACTN|nr:helix-turn-helix transcriptional regulator [Streptomyces dysideae]KUO18726.1 DNA-binding protein [Streptomyces dysideae]
MAGRAAPTARRTRLGTELRKLRERAGMTTTQAASLLGTSSGQLSNIEVARFGVSADRVRVMARTYSCTDPALVEALVEMTGERRRGWWAEYREILPPRLLGLAEIEHHGTHLHAAHSMHVPGLLQTVDYAREIFRQAVPEMSPPEIEHRLSFRIKRQAVLYQTDPIPYRAVIHEAALLMRFGGPDVTRAQLQHLLKVNDHDHVTVRVIPFDAGSYPGSGQSVYFVRGSVPALDTAQLDQSHGPVFIDSEAQLAQYRLLLDRLEATALSPVESRNLIHSLTQNL